MAVVEITEREVINRHLADASAEAVWAAFENPEKLARWWGPDGFTNTIHEFEFTTGGDWKYTMHSPDGTDFKNESRFVTLEKPGRILIEHIRTMHHFFLDITFAEKDGKTEITWRQEFDTAEEFERVKAFVPAANDQNLARLEAVAKE